MSKFYNMSKNNFKSKILKPIKNLTLASTLASTLFFSGVLAPDLFCQTRSSVRPKTYQTHPSNSSEQEAKSKKLPLAPNRNLNIDPHNQNNQKNSIEKINNQINTNQVPPSFHEQRMPIQKIQIEKNDPQPQRNNPNRSNSTNYNQDLNQSNFRNSNPGKLKYPKSNYRGESYFPAQKENSNTTNFKYFRGWSHSREINKHFYRSYYFDYYFHYRPTIYCVYPRRFVLPSNPVWIEIIRPYYPVYSKFYFHISSFSPYRSCFDFWFVRFDYSANTVYCYIDSRYAAQNSLYVQVASAFKSAEFFLEQHVSNYQLNQMSELFSLFLEANGSKIVYSSYGREIKGTLDNELGKLFDLQRYISGRTYNSVFQDEFELFAAAASAMQIFPDRFLYNLRNLKTVAPAHYDLAADICRLVIEIYDSNTNVYLFDQVRRELR